MITIQNRTLGQLQMLQVQSAGPPALADGQAGCGMCCVIVGRGDIQAGRTQHVKPIRRRSIVPGPKRLSVLGSPSGQTMPGRSCS